MTGNSGVPDYDQAMQEYAPDRYISREPEDTIARNYLSSPAQPPTLWGPQFYGKTWQLEHLLATAPNPFAVPPRALRLNFVHAPLPIRAGRDDFYLWLAQQLMAQMGESDEVAERYMRRPATPVGNLTRLMERQVLSCTEGLSVVIIDNVDAVFGTPYQEELFLMLRGWASGTDELWSRLRMMFALSTSLLELFDSTSHTNSPFNIVPPVRLREFNAGEVRLLAEAQGCACTEDELALLMARVGGHPYLSFLAVSHAARTGVPLPQTLEGAGEPDGIFHEFLAYLHAQLEAQAWLKEAVIRCMARADYSLDPRAYYALYSLGVAAYSQPGPLRVTCEVCEQFLRANFAVPG